jgi:hypothetical protein
MSLTITWGRSSGRGPFDAALPFNGWQCIVCILAVGRSISGIITTAVMFKSFRFWYANYMPGLIGGCVVRLPMDCWWQGARVRNEQGTTQVPTSKVFTHLLDCVHICGVAGKHPTPNRDSLPGYCQGYNHLGSPGAFFSTAEPAEVVVFVFRVTQHKVAVSGTGSIFLSSFTITDLWVLSGKLDFAKKWISQEISTIRYFVSEAIYMPRNDLGGDNHGKSTKYPHILWLISCWNIKLGGRQ